MKGLSPKNIGGDTGCLGSGCAFFPDGGFADMEAPVGPVTVPVDAGGAETVLERNPGGMDFGNCMVGLMEN